MTSFLIPELPREIQEEEKEEEENLQPDEDEKQRNYRRKPQRRKFCVNGGFSAEMKHFKTPEKRWRR